MRARLFRVAQRRFAVPRLEQHLDEPEIGSDLAGEETLHRVLRAGDAPAHLFDRVHRFFERAPGRGPVLSRSGDQPEQRLRLPELVRRVDPPHLLFGAPRLRFGGRQVVHQQADLSAAEQRLDDLDRFRDPFGDREAALEE
jgi:hypothetical protein